MSRNSHADDRGRCNNVRQDPAVDEIQEVAADALAGDHKDESGPLYEDDTHDARHIGALARFFCRLLPPEAAPVSARSCTLPPIELSVFLLSIGFSYPSPALIRPCRCVTFF